MSWSILLQKKQPLVIGMIHLPPLPGAPRYKGEMKRIIETMMIDVEALTNGGVDALMMENFGDVPFSSGRVSAETVAVMTALGCEVRGRSPLPLGINVLRNDGQSALAVALACGASFIRVNVLSGARVTDQGLIQGIAHDLMRLRSRLGASNIAVMADVDVKHSAALAPRDLSDEVEDTWKRGLADALIVSGAGTGKSTDSEKVKRVLAVSGETPVFLGSGVTEENVDQYPGVRGFIVGSTFKPSGAAVDEDRVRSFMKRVSSLGRLSG